VAYFVPYIDDSGLHIPTYADIRDALVEDARSIFGTDIYLDNDSADYQYIAVIALKIHDALSALELAYNNRGPASAIGSGLDGVVRLNGISRAAASYSTCQVKVTGDSGTLITGGVVRDQAGYLWDLPAAVTIPIAGHITVSAVCQTIGAIGALIGIINEINTPTKGWISVTNEAAAVPGNPVETDAELRARQTLSVALPSQTLLEGTTAAILTVANVTRAIVYENDTSEVSVPDGFPPHSITPVVEGGTDADIAQQIYEHKGIGGYINGTTVVVINDLYGQPNYIRFYRPTYVPIFATVTLTTLASWSPAMTAQIKQAIADYLNSLKIGDDVTISALWGAVLCNVMPDLRNPAFSITGIEAGILVGSQGTTDIVLAFNEAAQGDIANVAVVTA
jgi:uncharacterized phage protein gp47/JayE